MRKTRPGAGFFCCGGESLIVTVRLKWTKLKICPRAVTDTLVILLIIGKIQNLSYNISKDEV